MTSHSPFTQRVLDAIARCDSERPDERAHAVRTLRQGLATDEEAQVLAQRLDAQASANRSQQLATVDLETGPVQTAMAPEPVPASATTSLPGCSRDGK